MATEELNIDLGSVERKRIGVYSLPNVPSAFGDPPVTGLRFEGVETRSPYKGIDRTRVHDVEVEYASDRGGRALDLDTMQSYLSTYEEAKVTEEVMAQTIRDHLLAALDTDDVFVEVRRSNSGIKDVRLGAPQ